MNKPSAFGRTLCQAFRLGNQDYQYYSIVRRRLIYLQHILKQKETSLVKQFLRTQIITLKKKYWGTTGKEDIFHLGLERLIEDVKIIPKYTYTKLIKQKILEGL